MFLLVHPETTDIPDRILLPRMVPSSKPFFLEENPLKTSCIHLFLFDYIFFLLGHPDTTDIPDRILLPRMVPASMPFFLEENHVDTSCIHLFLLDYNIFWHRCYFAAYLQDYQQWLDKLQYQS